MKYLVLLFAIFSFNQAQAIQCEATFEEGVATERYKKETTKLEVEYESDSVLQLVADIGDFHYNVQGQKGDSDYLLMITLGPDYTRGVTARLTWDKNNFMRISRVDGGNVYKLSCAK